MKIRKAQKQQSKIKLGIQGPAGSGKTYSSLLLASGLNGSLNGVCIIDTENGSADLYSDLGPYSVIPLGPPYAPEKYISAIQLAYDNGFKVVIIDSLSHAWEFLLDYHSSLPGNSFTNWSKVTPRHKELIQTILNTPCHFICSKRSKTEYVLNQKGNGKMVPEKVGMKSIQRDGTDYEFTILFELDINQNASCTKDRTGFFMDKPSTIIKEKWGHMINDWCGQGISIEHLSTRINESKSLKELLDLYQDNFTRFPELKPEFSKRKIELQNAIDSNGR